MEADTEVREYPITGMTCDHCSAGDVAVRVLDDSYVCEECDQSHDAAIDAAAALAGVSFGCAAMVVETYLGAMNDAL